VAWSPKTKDFYECANIHVIKYETASRLDAIIRSFNLTTNSFAAIYIFKRLKFLNIRAVSQLTTLLFLSIWHGIDTGYLVCFTLEFLLMKTEVDVIARFEKLGTKYPIVRSILNFLPVRVLLLILGRLWVIFFLGYSFICMMFIKYSAWSVALSELYYVGHVITISWLFIDLILHLTAQKKK